MERDQPEDISTRPTEEERRRRPPQRTLEMERDQPEDISTRPTDQEERRRRPPRGTLCTCHDMVLFLAEAQIIATSVIAVVCCRCCFQSGLCLCFTCLFQPFRCIWSCVEGKHAQGLQDVCLFAWQCVQFWTPFSLTVCFLWLLYRPDRFHPRVDSAVLADLDLATSNSSASAGVGIRYDMAMDLSLRNSHRRLSIRYLDVGATAFYNGTMLSPAENSLPSSFHQGPKNTTVLHPAFRGVVAVDSGVAAELERERATGTVHVRVTVDLTLRYKLWFVEEVFFYKYDCWLWFPAPQGTPAIFHGDGAQCWRV